MEILESWKCIADYLDRDVRTVQRWEQCRGLPVHRIPGDGKPGVWADKQEIDTWRHRRAPGFLEGNLSIAVLPFVNLTGDPNQACFCEALADDIITGLAQHPGTTVAARSSSLAFRDWEGPVEQIAAWLHVSTIVEGAVKGAGSEQRISVQWINARTGFHLWSGQFQCDQREANLRAQIVRAVVTALTGTRSTASGT